MKEKNMKIGIVVILILILLLSIVTYIIYTVYIKESETGIIENIDENEMSYMQGPLKQNIENLDYNSIEYIHVTDKVMAKKYFNYYIQTMINEPKKAYELLEQDYREKRFNSEESYQQFVQSNLPFLKQLEIENISVSGENNSKQYTIKDKYGNSYLFKETAVMEYTVQLDDYTLENELFNEIYEEASKRDKGLLNVAKFFKMINTQDYQSAYQVLDENFKQTYFPKQADFENYIKTRMFRYNRVNYKEYSNQIANIHAYKVVLSDITGENQNEIEFNIVMKLLEETNFVMSFAI